MVRGAVWLWAARRHDACLRVDSWDAACTSALFTVGGLCDGFSNVFRLCLSIAGNVREIATR